MKSVFTFDTWKWQKRRRQRQVIYYTHNTFLAPFLSPSLSIRVKSSDSLSPIITLSLLNWSTYRWPRVSSLSLRRSIECYTSQSNYRVHTFTQKTSLSIQILSLSLSLSSYFINANGLLSSGGSMWIVQLTWKDEEKLSLQWNDANKNKVVKVSTPRDSFSLSLSLSHTDSFVNWGLSDRRSE